MPGAIFFDGSWAFGTVPAPAPFFGVHCLAPAGLVVSSQSVLEEVLEEIVVPPGRRRGPRDLETARDGVGSPAGLVAALPAETLFLEVAALRFAPDVLIRGCCTMGLAECMTAGNQRHRLFIVHRHPAEGLADVARGGDRIGVAVGPFGIHVNQPHLNSAEGIGQLAIAAVAFVTEPRRFGAPVDVLRLPDILASAGEAKRLEPHRLQGDVAREHHQVGPRNLAAVLLLDWPQQPARLVDVRVVGPAAKRGKPDLARPGTAAAIVDAVRARAVPRHPDEEPTVVAEVRRPPVLRRRHHRRDVLLQRREIDALELVGVVELRAHRIACRVLRMEGVQVQLIRPPVAVRSATARGCRERALSFATHVDVTSVFRRGRLQAA